MNLATLITFESDMETGGAPPAQQARCFSLSAPQSLKDFLTMKVTEAGGTLSWGEDDNKPSGGTIRDVDIDVHVLLAWIEFDFGKLEHVSHAVSSPFNSLRGDI